MRARSTLHNLGMTLSLDAGSEEWQPGLEPNIRAPRVSGAASPSYP
jgi:hypothetical protein